MENLPVNIYYLARLFQCIFIVHFTNCYKIFFTDCVQHFLANLLSKSALKNRIWKERRKRGVLPVHAMIWVYSLESGQQTGGFVVVVVVAGGDGDGDEDGGVGGFWTVGTLCIGPWIKKMVFGIIFIFFICYIDFI